MISIKSNSSERELRFLSIKGDYFQLELLGNPSLTHSTYGYTDLNRLADLFEDLGKVEKPWSGIVGWASLEEDFSMEISCSSLGQIQFEFQFRDLPGGGEESSVKVGLISELGMLAQISRQARDFFS